MSMGPGISLGFSCKSKNSRPHSLLGVASWRRLVSLRYLGFNAGLRPSFLPGLLCSRKRGKRVLHWQCSPLWRRELDFRGIVFHNAGRELRCVCGGSLDSDAAQSPERRTDAARAILLQNRVDESGDKCIYFCVAGTDSANPGDCEKINIENDFRTRIPAPKRGL